MWSEHSPVTASRFYHLKMKNSLRVTGEFRAGDPPWGKKKEKKNAQIARQQRIIATPPTIWIAWVAP